MRKEINKDNVFYNIIWSQPSFFNRHTVMGIPGLAGIVCIFRKKNDVIDYMLFYASWKSGVRNGARDLLDPNHSQFPEFITLSDNKELMFKYAIVDTNPKDMQDIMYWLIKEYQPELNNSNDFMDSQRYKDIFLLEMYEGDDIDKNNFLLKAKK